MKMPTKTGIRLLCLYLSACSPATTVCANTVTTTDGIADSDSLPSGTTLVCRQTDTSDRLGPKDLILPSALIAAGFFGVYNGSVRKLNTNIRDGFYDLRGDCRFEYDNYLQYLPIAAYVGLGCAGINTKHNLKCRLMAGTTAYISMGIMVNAIKYTVKERRPDSSTRNSFPSGHTATAFMGAELVRLEYGTGPAIGAYSVATAVAFFRLYNNRHWLTDVVAGAGIGLLSARIGYMMLPLYQKWFHWDTSPDCTLAIIPSYDPTIRNLGIGITASF